jgi:CRP-like cAMP-binding protein
MRSFVQLRSEVVPVEARRTDSFRILESVIFLKKSFLFSTMKTGELRAIAAVAEEVRFDGGEEIVRENDVGDSMYLIREGVVRVVKNAGVEHAVDLARLSTGDCFGEMAIFDAETRSASVYAEGPCAILRIGSDDLVDVILDHPTIALELLKIFVRRLRKANDAIQELSVDGRGGTNA